MRFLDHPCGLRVAIDRTRCVCSEMCAALAPSTFETDDAGLVSFLGGGDDDERALREAARCCPAGAISVESTPR